uniref:Uncharacterized protein n=1 Tax=Cacopsylla melanoneura TaxID=428564 RepID=A0A8D9BC47_9HEMI
MKKSKAVAKNNPVSVELQTQILEDHPEGILMFLFLLWEDGVTACLLIPLFLAVAKLARIQGDITLKKMAISWLDMIKEVRVPGSLQSFDQSSFENFKRLISKTSSYMTSIQFQINSELRPALLREYEEVLKTHSASSHTMGTTSTSSTTVRSKVTNAAVPISTKSPVDLDSGSDDDLFLGSSSASNMPNIQCSIWKKEADWSITYRSAGVSGHDLLVKLDLYDYAACRGLSKENYWKTATYRTLFSASSDAPTGQVVKKLLKVIGKEFKRGTLGQLSAPDVREQRSFTGLTVKFGLQRMFTPAPVNLSTVPTI